MNRLNAVGNRGGCTVSIPVNSLDSVAQIDLVLISGNGEAIPVEVSPVFEH